ncbi:MAG: AzlC family ABC transporter permease [Kiritimatiellae bacterium]|nr:AzlC family ABC transporter permease [Kiritimatiellia bacterium]
MKKDARQEDERGRGGGTASFGRGFADALPICFGYFAVGFTVAVAAVVHGHPVWSPLLMSGTHVSGTSQGAIAERVDFMSGPMAGWWEVALLCLALNLRYVLLALALAQKLPPGTGFGKRLLLAYGVTDENVALAVSRPFELSFRYVAGLMLSSWLGWNAGTVCGAFGAAWLPADRLAPLGIALYAMFVAIVVPAARASRPMLLCVALAAGLNAGFSALPQGVRPPAGAAMLVSGVVAAGVCALLFPAKRREGDGGGKGEAA